MRKIAATLLHLAAFQNPIVEPENELITVDLLRHGELVGGIKYRGKTDDPLTAAGRAAMDTVWQQVSGDVGLIVTSPLSRCHEPATAWAEAKGIDCIVDERIVELDYGDWEGLTQEEIRSRYPGVLERWRSDPESVAVPGGESIHSLQERISRFWTDFCSGHNNGAHLLVIGHSGSLRMLVTHVLGAPIASSRHLQMPYGCWSRISHEQGSSRVEFLNRNP